MDVAQTRFPVMADPRDVARARRWRRWKVAIYIALWVVLAVTWLALGETR
jgi:hypothetical protein